MSSGEDLSSISAGVATACPTLYLLPSSYINNDLAINTAAQTRLPISRSNSPDCMAESPCSKHGREASSSSTRVDVSSEASLKRLEQIDTRPFHSRTFYHPACLDHASGSPPFCSPVFSVLFQDDSKGQESSLPILEPSASFERIRKLRHSFHLSQLLPTCTYPAFLDSPSLWLALYFALNLSLTLYNKAVLIHFPFPYTLTALHALCGTVGASIVLRLQGPDLRASAPMNETTPKTSWSFFHKITPVLSVRESIILLLFSMLYTINIVVSNASLRLVTVPFHQVVRASTPFFTIVFSLILFGKRCTKRKLLTLVPVVAGVGFATYGDYYFTTLGFLLTLLGTLLAALKTILTNIILIKPPASPLPFSSDSPKLLPDDASNQSSVPATSIPKSPTSSFILPKLSLSPLHLLYLLSPLAFIQTMLLAHFTGELRRVQLHLFHSSFSVIPEGASANFRIWLVSNGILAFFLNVVSFHANRRVGPLAMSVAANVKQVLTVLCAVVIFDLTITPANGLGILLTLGGGALYAAVEFREKQSGRRFR